VRRSPHMSSTTRRNPWTRTKDATNGGVAEAASAASVRSGPSRGLKMIAVKATILDVH
jgi:hypothetical protein